MRRLKQAYYEYEFMLLLLHSHLFYIDIYYIIHIGECVILFFFHLVLLIYYLGSLYKIHKKYVMKRNEMNSNKFKYIDIFCIYPLYYLLSTSPFSQIIIVIIIRYYENESRN